MSYFATDSAMPTTISYEVADGGAGHESRKLSSKWREAVVHFCTPVSMQERAIAAMLVQLGWEETTPGPIPVAHHDALEFDWHLEPDELKF
ncbi:hypothetical protein [Sorangium sp. So ce131]|uniref:hypothetical protein n=1 Tax=Sorangium sp. So ce131 TaxID=3133282 RepID=UPI003F6188B5